MEDDLDDFRFQAAESVLRSNASEVGKATDVRMTVLRKKGKDVPAKRACNGGVIKVDCTDTKGDDGPGDG